MASSAGSIASIRGASSSPEQGSDHPADETPLVVDVDGTLVASDLLLEGISRLAAASPLRLLLLPWWLARGRAYLKRQVSRASSVRPESVPMNDSVLREVRHALEADRQVWLASGADDGVVAPFADRIGATGIIASDGTTNLIANKKARVLVGKFGVGGFDYIGNGRQDVPVWAQCRHALGVALSEGVRRRLQRMGLEPTLLAGQGGTAKDTIAALRPHQWVKNLLVFVPPLAAHSVDPMAYLFAAGAFFALSLCTCGIYIFNDFLDLPHDRQHASKRRRPLASGRTPLGRTCALGLLATVAGLALAFALPGDTGACIFTYLGGALGYALFAKRQYFLDVLVLASLYVLRILVGGAAADIEISPWLTAFSMFAFLGVATVKRLVELRGTNAGPSTSVAGRAYVQEDAAGVLALASASAFASVVVLAVYIGSDEMVSRYGNAELLWLACPLLIYWFGRLTLLANRALVDDDPVAFAIRDKVSWIVGFGIAGVFLLSA